MLLISLNFLHPLHFNIFSSVQSYEARPYAKALLTQSYKARLSSKALLARAHTRHQSRRLDTQSRRLDTQSRRLGTHTQSRRFMSVAQVRNQIAQARHPIAQTRSPIAQTRHPINIYTLSDISGGFFSCVSDISSFVGHILRFCCQFSRAHLAAYISGYTEHI